MTKKITQKRTGKLGSAPTMAAAASKTGFSMAVISAAKDAGCPAFKTRGDVDCDLLIEWLGEHPEVVAQAGVVDKELEEALKTRAQRKIFEHKLDEAKRRVIPVDEVKRTYTRSVLAAKSKLFSCQKSIGMKAKMRAGLLDEQITTLMEIVEEEHREVAREMSKGGWFVPACPNCAGAM